MVESKDLQEEMLKQSAHYDENVITSMIRESLDDPGGKTYVILIYFNTDISSHGYIETPIKYDYDRYIFTIYTEIPIIMRRVSQDNGTTTKKHLAKQFLKLLRKRNAVHAIWAIHFWERPDGDFEGRAYYVPEHRETVFYGSANLIKILSSTGGRKKE